MKPMSPLEANDLGQALVLLKGHQYMLSETYRKNPVLTDEMIESFYSEVESVPNKDLRGAVSEHLRTQIESLFQNIHECVLSLEQEKDRINKNQYQVRLQDKLLSKVGFTLQIQPSPSKGLGLFIKGSALPGTVVVYFIYH